MKRPAKGRANVTLIVDDGKEITRVETSDCDRDAGMRVLRAGYAESENTGGAVHIDQKAAPAARKTRRPA